MAYQWDNYSRALAIGWLRHMPPIAVADSWPWPRRPRPDEIEAEFRRYQRFGFPATPPVVRRVERVDAAGSDASSTEG